VNLLGIDTSTPASAACVVRADGEAFEVEPAAGRLRERPGHSVELLPAAVDCLERAGLGWDELDAVAVGIGPGAFTGLRIGVVTARALAAARGLELRPVSSLRALAAGSDEQGATLAVIDARRGEVFAALYGDGDELWEPFVAAPEAVAKRLAGARPGVRAVGDGAVRCRDVFEAAGVEILPDGARGHVVRGLHVCRIGAAVASAALETVTPHYLRQPDAKPIEP